VTNSPDVLLEQITDIVCETIAPPGPRQRDRNPVRPIFRWPCPTTGTTKSSRMPETIGLSSSGLYENRVYSRERASALLSLKEFAVAALY